MPEGRDAADRVARGDARRLGVRLGHRFPRHGGQALLIEPVGTADQGHDRPAPRDENERLHDLPDLAADGAGGVAGSAGALRKLLDRDSEVSRGQPRLEAIHGI